MTTRPSSRRSSRRATPCFEILEDRVMPSLTMQIDYRFDTQGWFADQAHGQERRTILNLAAKILTSRIEDSFAAINPATPWNYSDNNGNSGSWIPEFEHPGEDIEDFHGDGLLDQFFVPKDTLIVFAGAKELSTLHDSAIGFGGSGLSFFGDSAWQSLMKTRGQNGKAPWGGAVTFDSNTDFYYGLGSPSGKDDFLSVCLHELGHVLGLDHQPEGTMSDGAEAAMDPTNTTGNRKMFTALDWQSLSDLGYQIDAASAIVAARFFNDRDDDGRFDSGEANGALKEFNMGYVYQVNTPFGVGGVAEDLRYFLQSCTFATIHSLSDATLQKLRGNISYYFGVDPTPFDDNGDEIDLPGQTGPRKPYQVILMDVAMNSGQLGLTESIVGSDYGYSEPAVGPVLIGGQNGAYDDVITVKRSGSNIQFIANGQTTTKPFAAVSQIIADTSGGDDTLTVDFRYGNPIPYDGLRFDGAEGLNTLRVRGNTFTNAFYAVADSGGSLILDGSHIDFGSLGHIITEFSAVNLDVRAGRFITGGSLHATGQVTVGITGTVGGTGALGANLSSFLGGRIDPADGTGVNTGRLSTRNLQLGSGSSLVIDIDGADAGVSYDQLDVAGSVKISSAALQIDLGIFGPSTGQSFTIVKNDGTDAVQGTFKSLSEGAEFVNSGYRFRISYKGGDGNDIVVTALNNSPSLGGLTLSKSYITTGGSDIITMTVVPGPGRVDGVEFWLDLNQNGRIDTSTDRLLKYHDALNLSEYYFTGAIGGVSVGTYTVFARARRYTFSDVFYSDPLTATLQVVAAPPLDNRSIAIGAETRANHVTTGDQLGAQVTYDAQGNYSVFWYDRTSGAIYRSRYLASGAANGSPVTVGIAGPLDDVAMNAAGSFAIAWEDQSTGALRLKEYDANGNQRSTGFVALDTAGSYRSGSARLSMTGAGTWAVIWEHGGYFDGDIYMVRYINGAGVFSGKLNANHPTTAPAVALDVDGNLLAVWTDYSTGRVRGARGRSNGTMVAGEFSITSSSETINFVDDFNMWRRCRAAVSWSPTRPTPPTPVTTFGLAVFMFPVARWISVLGASIHFWPATACIPKSPCRRTSRTATSAVRAATTLSSPGRAISRKSGRRTAPAFSDKPSIATACPLAACLPAIQR